MNYDLFPLVTDNQSFREASKSEIINHKSKIINQIWQIN